jgi:hypothetical protein
MCHHLIAPLSRMSETTWKLGRGMKQNSRILLDRITLLENMATEGGIDVLRLRKSLWPAITNQ